MAERKQYVKRRLAGELQHWMIGVLNCPRTVDGWCDHIVFEVLGAEQTAEMVVDALNCYEGHEEQPLGAFVGKVWFVQA